MTTAQWFCLDEKDAERPRWKKKCLQKCILELCSGPKHKHGERLFNRRCCNDAATGYGSFFGNENIVSVKDFLHVHAFHLVILELKQDGRCENNIGGSGDHCLGNVFWDTLNRHASIVPNDIGVDTFETCVSSEPWTRSTVGTESSTHTFASNMKLFKPLSSAPEADPDGYFLIDSFHSFKKSKKKAEYYLPRLLEELKRHTGHTIFALCS